MQPPGFHLSGYSSCSQVYYFGSSVVSVAYFCWLCTQTQVSNTNIEKSNNGTPDSSSSPNKTALTSFDTNTLIKPRPMY